MPLSEHEERILAEIEQQLERDDPTFVTRNRRTGTARARRRQLRLSIAGFVVGFVCLLAVAVELILGLVGFVIMLVSVLAGANALRDGGGGSNLVERLRAGIERPDDHDRQN